MTSVVPDDGGFRVLLTGGRTIRSRRLLVTTGLTDVLPDVPGLADRWARDVLHCPYCHGHEVRDQQFGVVGDAPGAVRYAQIVRQWTHDLVYFTPPGLLTADERSGLVARAIGVVEARSTGSWTRTMPPWRRHGRRLDRPPRRPLRASPLRPAQPPLADLGCATDDDGWVTADGTGRTSVTGVWAAGNVIDPRAQVVTAAGADPAAAIDINADLVDDDVREALTADRYGYL